MCVQFISQNEQEQGEATHHTVNTHKVVSENLCYHCVFTGVCSSLLDKGKKPYGEDHETFNSTFCMFFRPVWDISVGSLRLIYAS